MTVSAFRQDSSTPQRPRTTVRLSFATRVRLITESRQRGLTFVTQWSHTTSDGVSILTERLVRMCDQYKKLRTTVRCKAMDLEFATFPDMQGMVLALVPWNSEDWSICKNQASAAKSVSDALGSEWAAERQTRLPIEVPTKEPGKTSASCRKGTDKPSSKPTANGNGTVVLLPGEEHRKIRSKVSAIRCRDDGCIFTTSDHQSLDISTTYEQAVELIDIWSRTHAADGYDLAITFATDGKNGMPRLISLAKWDLFS